MKWPWRIVEVVDWDHLVKRNEELREDRDELGYKLALTRNDSRRHEHLKFQEVTRITLVSNEGVEFEKYNLYEHGVELHLQDDGRTLKIFPRKESE